MSEIEQAIAADLNRCDLGIALTKGRLRRRYIAHRKACFAELARMNRADGLSDMSDERLLDELNL